jgi:hypothetical protein
VGKFKVDVNAENGHAKAAAAPAEAAETEHEHEEAAENGTAGADFVTTATTIGVVAVAAALIDVALIPGLVIGVAAAFAPKYVPKLGERLEPLFNSTVRGAYKLGRKARSAVGEVRESLSDIAAEVEAEEVAAAGATHEAAHDAGHEAAATA